MGRGIVSLLADVERAIARHDHAAALAGVNAAAEHATDIATRVEQWHDTVCAAMDIACAHWLAAPVDSPERAEWWQLFAAFNGARVDFAADLATLLAWAQPAAERPATPPAHGAA